MKAFTFLSVKDEILTGLTVLNNTLEPAVHETFKQRIVVKHNFNGIFKCEIDFT